MDYLEDIERIRGWQREVVMRFEDANDSSLDENERDVADSLHQGYMAKIEQLAFERGIEVEWPGLYAVYTLADRRYLIVEDAFKALEAVAS